MINIKFTLLDSDFFYRQGLFFILKEYIHALKESYLLYPQQVPADLAALDGVEIIFRSQDEDWGCAYCYQSERLTPLHRQITVMLLDKQDHHQVKYPEQLCIYRKDSVYRVRQTLQLIAERFYRQPSFALRTNNLHKCPRCQIEALSNREKQVLKLMSTGMSATIIAEKLHRSQKTISSHKRSAMRKLNVNKSTELNKLLLKQRALVSPVVAHSI